MNHRSAVPVIATVDVRTTIDYYVRVLGFSEYFTYGDPLEYAGIQRDDAQIYITRNQRLVSALKTSNAHPEVFLWVSDVDRVFGEHLARGAKIVEPISDRPWDARQYVIEDPNGYLIKVAEPLPEPEK